MATTIVTKSESTDLYVFVRDSKNITSFEKLIEDFKKEWYLEDTLYLEAIYSEEFDVRTLTNEIINII